MEILVMKISVKILQGQECSVNVTTEDTVDKLKELVSKELTVPVDCQRLLCKGKTLQDGTYLKEYNLKEGDKLHLVVKKETTGPTTNGSSAAGNNSSITATGTTAERSRVEEEIFRLFRGHLSSDAEAERLLAAFLKCLEKRLTTLSLDDIERICERWQREDRLSF